MDSPAPEPDPYAPPAAAVRASDAAPAPGEIHALCELVRGWEKLRLLYNAILLPAGLIVLSALVIRSNLPVPAAIAGGLFVGFGANAAFFLGPLAELYLRGWLTRGAPFRHGRKVLFIAGLAVSLLVFLFWSAIAILA